MHIQDMTCRWLIPIPSPADITSHMSKWLVEACCSSPLCLIGLACWSVEGDAGWALCVSNWRDKKTAHTRHRGYWWNGDNPDVEQLFPFVLRPKLANRSLCRSLSSWGEMCHGAWVGTAWNRPRQFVSSVSVWTPLPFEIHLQMCSLVSSCQRNFKWPPGMSQELKIVLHVFALVGLMPKQFKTAI